MPVWLPFYPCVQLLLSAVLQTMFLSREGKTFFCLSYLSLERVIYLFRAQNSQLFHTVVVKSVIFLWKKHKRTLKAHLGRSRPAWRRHYVQELLAGGSCASLMRRRDQRCWKVWTYGTYVRMYMLRVTGRLLLLLYVLKLLCCLHVKQFGYLCCCHVAGCRAWCRDTCMHPWSLVVSGHMKAVPWAIYFVPPYLRIILLNSNTSIYTCMHALSSTTSVCTYRTLSYSPGGAIYTARYYIYY